MSIFKIMMMEAEDINGSLSRHQKTLLIFEIWVERIVDARGRPDNRFYKVHWRGYSPEADTWQHQSDVLNAPDAVDDYWAASEHDRSMPIWPAGVFTCEDCCKTYKRLQDLKGHHTKGNCEFKCASRMGTRAHLLAKRKRKAAAQLAAGSPMVEWHLSYRTLIVMIIPPPL